MQALLNFKMRWGLPNILVRWAGHGCDASRDTWEQYNLNCDDAITAFKRASGRPLPVPRPAPPPPAVAVPLPIKIYRRCCAAGRSPCGARGEDTALLLASRQVAAWYSRTPLLARRLLARDGP